MMIIKTYEGFFDFFKKNKKEEDALILEIISRLEKVKGISPYDIVKESKGDMHENKWQITDYKIYFDDVPFKITQIKGDSFLFTDDIKRNLISKGFLLRNRGCFYRFKSLDTDEVVLADVKLQEKLYNIVEHIYNETCRLNKINNIRNNMNPAADLLD